MNQHTYKWFSSNSSFFIPSRNYFLNEERNISTKREVSILAYTLFHLFLSSCRIY